MSRQYRKGPRSGKGLGKCHMKNRAGQDLKGACEGSQGLGRQLGRRRGQGKRCGLYVKGPSLENKG